MKQVWAFDIGFDTSESQSFARQYLNDAKKNQIVENQTIDILEGRALTTWEKHAGIMAVKMAMKQSSTAGGEYTKTILIEKTMTEGKCNKSQFRLHVKKVSK